MKINKMAITALVMAGALTSARAGVSYGDLVLGFVGDSGELNGTTTNLEVDLGNVSSFIAAAPGTTFNVASLGTDLGTTYGSTWAGTSLSFGVVSEETGSQVAGAPSDTTWASSNLGSQSYNTLGGTISNSSSNTKIGAMLPGSGSAGTFGGGNTTALSDLTSQVDQVTGLTMKGFTVGESKSGSWTSEQGGAVPFSLSGGATASQLLTQAVTATGSGTDIYLEQLTNNSTNPSVDLGYFNLASDGTLTFTTLAAIPEPSTYAAILGAVTIAFVAIRRRKQSVLA